MLPRNHPDRIHIAFDDRRLVANAGLILPATLALHLGLPELVDRRLDLGDAPGRANTGAKIMTLVASALAGGDCIDDADVLRTGRTAGALGGTVKAPSTLGTFLRSFRWGHIRQLDRVSRDLLVRAWATGAGPDDAPFTIDLNSTICETYGLAKEGARHHSYTGQRGYHPLLAIAAGTGDVLMSRLREGRANTVRGAAHFLRETVGRVRYGGARGQLTVRADSGFYAHALVAVCREMDVRFSITIRQHKSLRNLIEAIPEDAWTPIPYWMDGAADVVETSYIPFQSETNTAPVRLIVRRVKPTPGSQPALFAAYSYHGCITDRDGETLELEADHRRHAEIENAIRDLKYGVGLNHLPSGRFPANGAWLAVQMLAHNLARWTARIGLGQQVVTTKTLRRRFFPSPDGSPTRHANSLCICPSAGPGKTSSVAPWHDCEQFHSQPDCNAGVNADGDLTHSPDYPTASQTCARLVPERLLLHATLTISPSIATAGRHHRSCAATSRRPHPHLLQSGQARSPSLAHHPWCQHQCPSLRWIPAYSFPNPPQSKRPPNAKFDYSPVDARAHIVIRIGHNPARSARVKPNTIPAVVIANAVTIFHADVVPFQNSLKRPARRADAISD